MIEKQEESSPPWTVPPDEKFGELNLHWPESVPYWPYPNREDPMRPPPPAGNHYVYGRSLDRLWFRLLCLSPIENGTDAIHATLETHPMDDCPEYETVSYCWGGENNDTERRHPVYIGDWYDVLLQTANCNAMLQYLRPRRGIRLVWVDAICINQNDHFERQAQVTNMGVIYRNCSRAVVYLGKDAVRRSVAENTDKRSYPARRELQDYERCLPGSAARFKQLLELRYFQRVWVVQEIIQAPRVILPVEDMEFTASQLTGSRLNDQLDWSSTGVHWLQHICTGQVGSYRTLQRLLEQTRYSKATDPRDKVFALLGFMPPTQVLTPDYSVSCLHVYIGAMAHLLLNEHCVEILTNSPGPRAYSAAPSWLPEWTILDMGEQLKKLLKDEWEHSIPATPLDTKKYLDHHLRTTLGLEGPHWLPPVVTTSYLLGSRAIDPTVPHVQKTNVHATTCALSIPLVYLCEITSTPVELIDPFSDDYYAHRYEYDLNRRIFQITMPNWKLFLCITCDLPLDETIGPEPTSLFLLTSGLDVDLILFMKRADSESDYRLLKCCYSYGLVLEALELPAPGTERFKIQILEPPDAYRENALEIPLRPINYADKSGVYLALRTVYEVLSELVERFEAIRSYSWAVLREIGSHLGAQGEELDLHKAESYLLEMFQRLAVLSRERDRKRESNTAEKVPGYPFFDWYLKFLLHCYPKYELHLQGRVPVGKGEHGYFISVPAVLNDGWYKVHDALFGSPSPDKIWPVFTPGSPLKSRHRLIGDLAAHLMQSPYFEIFSTLNYCSQLVKEDVLSLATTMPPKDEYKSILYYEWPEAFCEGDKVPGKIEHVTII
ncbi:hypothetical protein NM208_g2888 [Fusarium decemcellulare]|uniref:Uncharacterized protein n=1 Tax=Fusarium decemcellulare TaxID=57161 RepID=A0ACC1SRJ8_9HYPO|nr:hypothetical protein NM208_g2888 [Fusarium decemcellulare]